MSPTAGKSTNLRAKRVLSTRAQIVAVAERLFAERGVGAVSNRQISEAAGQGNNTAVGYHFGTKADLLRAIIHEHAASIEEIRGRLLVGCEGSTDLRDWVGCMVCPITEHLAGLGTPSWYGRLAAQLMTDPALRPLIIDDVLAAPTVRKTLAGLNRCLPDLPARVRAERNDLARTLLLHACAERERTLSEAGTVRGKPWEATANGLIDAVTGLFLAPVTRR
jgi:AcrR family transcriptional regulator